MQKRGFIWLKATMYDFKTHATHTRAFILLQKRTESDRIIIGGMDDENDTKKRNAYN